MKKLLLLSVSFVSLSLFSQGSFKILNNELIQIGYSNYKTLSFGNNGTTPNNGVYALESIGGGFNFWRPWPASNSGNYVMFMRSDRNIGIGTQGSLLFRLDVNGGIRCSQLLQTSDEILKTDIRPVKGSLNKLLLLNPVTYKMKPVFDTDVNAVMHDDAEDTEIKLKTIEEQRKAEASYEFTQNSTGFIAQELKSIFPELVVEDEKGTLAISYMELIPHLVESIKELHKEIEELKLKIKN